MRIVAIIQARTASRRLPGKVLLDLAGRPMLWRQLERVIRFPVDQVVVATTDRPDDDGVEAVAREFGARCFRGDERDVLQRYVGAARSAAADIIVRLKADAPLFDAEVANRVVSALTDNLSSCDFSANVLQRTFPRGLDVEAFTYGALSWMDRLARSPEEREHVTMLPRGRLRNMFLCRSITDDRDNSDLRWTVNEPTDLEVMRKIYQELDLAVQPLGYRQIIALLRERDDLLLRDVKFVPTGPRRAAA